MSNIETKNLKSKIIDKDNPEWTDEMFAKAKPLKQVHPEIVAAQKAGKLNIKAIGRPKIDKPKKLTSLRLDVDVIAYFKKDGKGWQTRLNSVLKEFVSTHSETR